MKPKHKLLAIALLLLPSVLSLTGCAWRSLPLPPAVVKPPAVPTLPSEARQSPALEALLTNVSGNINNWQKRLEPASPPDKPAKEPMTD